MVKIIALGGGNKRRTKFSVEALEVDKEIVKLSGILSPKLLFIPTASSDLKEYIEDVKSHFKTLGCRVDSLPLLNGGLSQKQIENKILNSDIVYVGGGNTLKMMRLWRRLGVDIILKKAAKKGIVLSGVSAGAICWFKFGNSDSRRDKNPNADLIKIRGLNLLPLLFCPHFDAGSDRRGDLKKMMKKTSGVAIAVANCCAIEIIDNRYRIISSNDGASAYKAFWKNNEYYQEKIEKSFEFSDLKELLNK
jgi:dipeptidase E